MFYMYILTVMMTDRLMHVMIYHHLPINYIEHACMYNNTRKFKYNLNLICLYIYNKTLLLELYNVESFYFRGANLNFRGVCILPFSCELFILLGFYFHGFLTFTK